MKSWFDMAAQPAAVGQTWPPSAPGSQLSPISTTPLPQTGEQLLSLFALHPVGQQLSLLTQPVIMPPSGALMQRAWHPVPVSTRRTQPMFGHTVGQAPAPPSPMPVSQSSPD